MEYPSLLFLFAALGAGKLLDEMRLKPQIAPETIASAASPIRYRPAAANSLRLLGEFPAARQYGIFVAYNKRGRTHFDGAGAEYAACDSHLDAACLGNRFTLGIWSAEHFGKLPDRLLSWGTAALLVIPDLGIALGLFGIRRAERMVSVRGMASVDFETFVGFQQVARSGLAYGSAGVCAGALRLCRVRYATCARP